VELKHAKKSIEEKGIKTSPTFQLSSINILAASIKIAIIWHHFCFVFDLKSYFHGINLIETF